jgi:hypothetical protein
VTTLFAGTALHPMGADPNDAAAAFAEYALDRYWVWSHLAQFVGVVLLALALIAFTLELEDSRSAPWGGISVVLAVGLIAIAAALQAVDGVALKRVIDRSAAAAADQKAVAFEAAFAVRQIEICLAAFLSLITGLTIVAFGLTLYFNSKGLQWFAAQRFYERARLRAVEQAILRSACFRKARRPARRVGAKQAAPQVAGPVCSGVPQVLCQKSQ